MEKCPFSPVLRTVAPVLRVKVWRSAEGFPSAPHRFGAGFLCWGVGVPLKEVVFHREGVRG